MILPRRMSLIMASCLTMLCTMTISEYSEDTGEPVKIDIWYGSSQSFGDPGRAQRWINILGNIRGGTNEAFYSLNNGPAQPLSLGSDLHRLAKEGDFNVQIGWGEVVVGENHLQIGTLDGKGNHIDTTITLRISPFSKWPLPYAVDFRSIADLQQVVQISDGKWNLTNGGVRTSEPYYDRVLMMGDTTWTNYEALINLTVHDWTDSEPGPPTYNVTHFGVALRWRGHHEDGRQPSRRWHPLGAQGEFLLRDEGDSCRWRILFDGGVKDKPAVYMNDLKAIDVGQQIQIRARVETRKDGKSMYQFKQWMADQPEPAAWDLTGYEADDYPSGALCLVPHNSDVTIHSVDIKPIH